MSSSSFGFDNYASMLSDRILESLEDYSKPPLAIGIFGQWGSGKSTLLNEIYAKIDGVKLKSHNTKQQDRYIVPVLFNAWRFEKEEHLIIALLKTIYYAIKKQAKDSKFSDDAKFKESMRLGADILRFCITSIELSIASSFAKNKELPYYLEYIDRVEEYESRYFNINAELKYFTDAVSVVFLVDDLDRCLPDNVLKTLESIKLFLDIPGFAFVLAVDDDVVERGILYKYKDYGNVDNLSNLITGSEYIEKIISLPFKIPHISNDDSRSFFLERYPELFIIDKKELRDRQESDDNVAIDEELLALFAIAVPPVPRRLIRAAELYKTKMKPMEAAWSDIFHSNRIVVAKLVFLELFAPSIFRFGCYRRQLFFSDLSAWKEKHKSLYETDKIAAAYEKSYEEGRISQEQRDNYAALLKLVIETNNGRNGFRLDALFKGPEPANVDSVVKAYLQMSGQKIDTLSREKKESVDIGNVDEFIIDILSDDAQARKSAFAKVEERILPVDTVIQIADRAKESKRIEDVQWWRKMESVTDSNGWLELVNKTDVIKRLSHGEGNSTLLEILELTAKKLNPPYKKNDKIIKEIRWLREVEWDKLSPLGRYLRGFELNDTLTAQNITKWDEIEDIDEWSLSVPTSLSRVQSIICINDKSIAVAHDSRVSIFDIFSKARIVTLSHKSLVRSILYISGFGLVSAGDDGNIKIWDIEDKTKEPTVFINGCPVYSVVYMGELRLVCAGEDGNIRIWNIEDVTHNPTILPHKGAVYSVAYIGNSRIASGGDDGIIKVWDINDPSKKAAIFSHGSWVNSITYLGDSKIASGGRDGNIKVWKIDDKSKDITILSHEDWVFCVAHLGGSRIASGGRDGNVKIWDTNDKTKDAFVLPHGESMYAMTTFASSKIASGSSDGNIKIWDIAANQKELLTLTHGESVYTMVYLGDSRLASGGLDGLIKIWDINDNTKEPLVFAHGNWVNSIAWLGGSILASSGDDGNIKIWDMQKNKEEPIVLSHGDLVYSVIYLGGSLIASCGRDGAIKLWDRTKPEKSIGRFRSDGDVYYVHDGASWKVGRLGGEWNYGDDKLMYKCAWFVRGLECVPYYSFEKEKVNRFFIGADGLSKSND